MDGLDDYPARMNRLSALLAALLVAATLSAHAQSPEDQYVRIYNLIQQADALNGNGQFTQALPKYLEAQSALQRMQKLRPEWNPKVVNFRLNYLAEKIEAGAEQPRTPEPSPTPVPLVPAPTPKAEAPPEVAPAAAELQSEVARLQAEKAILEAKLKEALATQPAAIDARELSKAQERIQSLLKENELLKTSLEAEQGKGKTTAGSGEVEQLKAALAEARRKLAEQPTGTDTSAIEKAALQARVKQLMAATADAEALRAENAILKQQLAEAQTAAGTATADANRRTTETEARVAALQSDFQVLQLEKLALENRLGKSIAASVTAAAAQKAPASSSKELQAKVDQLTKVVTGLQARVEVFEAPTIPYTAEELALFATTQPKTAVTDPPTRRTSSRALPAGSAALAAEAQRNFAAKDYAKAEQNYQDILRQDEQNPTALANLATIQMEAGRLDQAEKSIQQALAVEPEDGYNLATLGKLRYQQEKYDEALDALSRAARVMPKNAEIQNYLGVTLSQKGLRGPAETALRKAILLDPNYASAHNNLAVIYATQTPPYIELARWHYQKALAAGHPKNEELEKVFSKKEAATK